MPPPPVPPDNPPWPIPIFKLRIDDLNYAGAKIWFESVETGDALKLAIVNVFSLLYTPETVPNKVQWILLVLRPMPGQVAYTFGTSGYKEMHFSLDHVVNSKSRAKEEILGVLTHEMVHCFQYNGQGQTPHGMIEGIADWVRLRAGLAPPHWKEGPSAKWDAGYEKTAYFLDWIEHNYGEGTIPKFNELLKEDYYRESIFEELTGQNVDQLWKLYQAYLEDKLS